MRWAGAAVGRRGCGPGPGLAPPPPRAVRRSPPAAAPARARPPSWRSPPAPPGTPPRSAPVTASGLSADRGSRPLVVAASGLSAGAPGLRARTAASKALPRPPTRPGADRGSRPLVSTRHAHTQASPPLRFPGSPVCLPASRQAQLWARAAIDGLAPRHPMLGARARSTLAARPASASCEPASHPPRSADR